MNETLFNYIYNLSLEEKQFISSEMESIWTFKSYFFFQQLASVHHQIGKNLKV